MDEVGMGCLAGPVVVCAVGFTNHFYNKIHKKYFKLRDSKLLSARDREKFAGELVKEKDLVYAIAQCFPTTIDKLNIYQASRLAMKRAIVALRLAQGDQNYLKQIILVDGKTKINGLKIEQMSIVKGDRKIFAIACASIIAKVHRDGMMARYAKKYPEYGFEKHKGYGTRFHKAQLASFGPCEIHRRSFRLAIDG
ncbi:MAG: ribonuclease HII [Candidatus Yanofskybacteria bacterium]|nr:ribonuclease HII [Candidatus Yanofskybacteria bacterium]